MVLKILTILFINICMKFTEEYEKVSNGLKILTTLLIALYYRIHRRT